jgi:hypothetical protein
MMAEGLQEIGQRHSERFREDRMAERARGTAKKKETTVDRNLKDTLHPDRAESDELGRTDGGAQPPAPGPRELPARAVHPDGRKPSEDE